MTIEFDDQLIGELQQAPIKRLRALLEQVFNSLSASSQEEWTAQEHYLLTTTVALVEELKAAELIRTHGPSPKLSGAIRPDCIKVRDYLSELDDHLAKTSFVDELEGTKSRFRAALGTGFSYQFSSGDLERVQELVNDLRTAISANEKLESDHKRRILARLERLQSELHKRMSDLDRFWGLIGDAGVVLGKLGTDAKPIVDRVREIADIVWQTQSRAEELPSGTKPPLLGDSSSKE